MNEDVLAGMSELLNAHKNKEIDREKAVARAEQLHPKAGPTMNRLISLGFHSAILIIGAAQLYFTMYPPGSASEDIEGQVQRAIEKVFEDGASPKTPPGYTIDPDNHGVYRQPGEEKLTWPHGELSRSGKPAQPKAKGRPAGGDAKAEPKQENRHQRRVRIAKERKSKRSR